MKKTTLLLIMLASCFSAFTSYAFSPIKEHNHNLTDSTETVILNDNVYENNVTNNAVSTNIDSSMLLAPGETCAEAIPMTIQDCSTGTPMTFDFSSGYDLGFLSCDPFANFGYWTSFVAPANGSVAFNFSGGANNIGIELFDACGGTSLGCFNNDFDDGDASDAIGGLTPGNTYYVAIWRDLPSGSADICIEEGPNCPPPTDLTAFVVNANTIELGWTGGTSWIVEYGPVGFVQGSADGTIVPTTSNPLQITDLSLDVEYEYYVQSDCGGEISDWAGPVQFLIEYCDSIPSSNDGQGVSNVTVGITDFPSLGDVTYEDQTSPVVNAFQGVETEVIIDFAHGFTYFSNIWIDFDDNLVFEPSELVFQGESSGGNPHSLDASFIMPLTAPVGEHRMRIGTADFGQGTPDPCYSGTWGVTLDFTINIQQLTCTLPEATFVTTPDCANDQFFIDVDVTSLGDATSLEISNNFDASTVQATANGLYQAGPFPFGNTVRVFVTNEQDNNCVIASDNFTVLACPPANDNCADAIVAGVNTESECTVVTPGTLLAATSSGIANGTCAGNTDNDVWYQFVANDTNQIISLINIAGSTNNLDHALYSGTCDNFTEIYCSTDNPTLATGLTVGNTYYVRVFSFGADQEDTTFNLCIRPGGDNVVVDQTTYTVEQLVTDILIGGECAEISNITFSTGTDFGQDNGIGYFTLDGDMEGFPFTEGVLLTSGDASAAAGPNLGNLSDGTSAWPGDPFLNTIVPSGNTNNATVLEFDFVPLAQEISFDFLMASEEYNGDSGGTFECTFSDAFAFLLTDPLGNTTNLAVIPGTNTPILVTNIHEANPGCPAINEQYFGGYTGDNLPPMQFDGRTVVFTAQAPVTVGQTYHIKLVIADANDSAFDSGVFLKAGSFDLGELNLGEDITIASGGAACFGEPITLDSGAPNLEHIWLRNGLPIDGETTSTIEVTEPDLYTALVYFSNQCFLQDDILVEFLPLPEANTPSDQLVCSVESSADFDLSLNDIFILGSQDPSEFTLTYHNSLEDAESGSNSISTSYTGTDGETVFIRVENNDTGCVSTTSFNLSISVPDHTAESVDIAECDDNDGNFDDLADFDLLAHNPNVLGTQDPANYIVTYHSSQADAENNDNALPHVYSSGNAVIYVRVEDAFNPTCFVVNSFNLIINDAPVALFDPSFDYEVCPNATTPISIGLIPSNFTEAEVSVAWLLDDVYIDGASGLILDSVLVEGDYSAEITFNASGCSTIVTAFVEELESCIFPEGISPGVSPGFNDSFDLSSFNVTRLEIYNRNGTLVYSKNNYSNEWVGQTNDGEELPVGTYFYTVVYDGGAKQRSAWVYINR
ncbi:MAG: gliding motility-associated C-terminal domain-containing protein [Winogradskyella sp.]|uniref:choice-of-anchor L domain-containing protein n=1 Tax=Winogradskyella sp. TaxID=1883156 RepID=UPI0025D2969D|nr:choice-of-anchor L domain-containing protein [Winogradskyella sp.]NRB59700.1 gliding motility-associated C-terminal domain-containing protein [Winogradskyella sp.]